MRCEWQPLCRAEQVQIAGVGRRRYRPYRACRTSGVEPEREMLVWLVVAVIMIILENVLDKWGD